MPVKIVSMNDSKSETQKQPFRINDSFVAPWGLANEELPMHLIWSGEFDKLSITYPSNLDIISLYNIEDEGLYTEKKGEMTIHSQDLVTNGYLGVVFVCPDICEESVIEYPIQVDFQKSDVKVESWSSKTHIIRPQIEIVDFPEKIVLVEESTIDPQENMAVINTTKQENRIEIGFQYVGFGMARVKVDAEAEGELISKEDTIYQDFIQSMIDAELHLQDVDELQEVPDEWTVDGDYEIPQEEIEELVRETREATTDESLLDEYDSDDLYHLADLLEKAEESANAGETPSIYQYMEMMLLTSILDVVDRHPTENVSMNKPDIKIETKAKAREMTIECKLKDSMDNKYPSESIKMEVEDRREEGGGIFEAELVTNWENYQIDPDEVFA